MSSVTYSSGATGPPDFRFLHYNDVYHINEGNTENCGGASRFISLVKQYRESPEYANQPNLLTFFSGDAFNPSLESSVTRGKHMPPVLNAIGTDVACLGNHDLDFGVETFEALKKKCKFPWLIANIMDPAVGTEVGLGHLDKTVMLTTSNGLKVGVIGLGEKEWLETINLLPPNLIFKKPSEVARELVPKMREAGADIVVCVSHQREPNDVLLAEEIPEGLVDIILGGHDHHYAHQLVNGVHIIRSGCDFKQLSYIEVRKKDSPGPWPKWHFDILRRDINKDTPADPDAVKLIERLTDGPKQKLLLPIGHTLVPLDARFSVIRQGESNLGNFVCDLMRYYYNSECAMMPAGTIRGDQIYPVGVISLGDMVNCFPFEDPVVVIKVKGKNIVEALENGISKLPALEGRFPHVSNITFTYDITLPPMKRILEVKLGGKPIDPERVYQMTTRGYVSRGKDGFDSLTPEAGAEYVVDEENGVLIAIILRQYFLSLKVIGKWIGSNPFRSFFGNLKRTMSGMGLLQSNKEDEADFTGTDVDSSDEEDSEDDELFKDDDRLDVKETEVAVKFGGKWKKKGLKSRKHLDDSDVAWTRSISPSVEGRIVDVNESGSGGEA